ncbi:MAG: (d)CMP kinase [Ignavibacteriales bacterium]|nr:(d)CMP kinase [Ignavibacteriales bacterium]
MSKKIIIAIDGPAGSGKSTIAKIIAERLGFLYLDTGAMYRAITFYAIKNSIVDDLNKIIDTIKDINISLNFELGLTHVILNGVDVTDKIRTPEVNSKVSEVSVIPEVRQELVRMQKEIGSKNNLVAEGRDTTTVVFPYADIKIFLTASIDERAKRRFKEFQEKAEKISLEDTKKNLEKRDNIDSNRKISPLQKAEDAIEIDTTNLSITEEIDLILEKISKRLNISHYN